MGHDRFDRLALLVNRGLSRRTVFAAAGSALVAAGLGTPARRVAAAQDATPEACPTTTPEENTEVARRYHGDAMSGHDLTVLDDLLLPASMHDAATFPDVSGTRDIFAALLQSFPDIQVAVDLTIAEGNQVATRWTATGTNTGSLRGNPPSGRAATWTGITLFTFKCGRIAQIQDQSDGLARMRQMGLLPELGAPTAATPEAASPASPAANCPAASVDENRAVTARWFTDAVIPRALDRLDEIVAPDAVLHAAGFPDKIGTAGMRDLFDALFDGFSDLQFTFEPGPAEGDLVLVLWTAHGTNDGAFQGIASTGREVSWTGMNIFRIACGQIAEIWTEADTLGRLQQLGVVSPFGTPAAATPAA
jgi:steroid delta-isomerase-like uncharacterized protein